MIGGEAKNVGWKKEDGTQDIERYAEKSGFFWCLYEESILFHLGPASRRDDRKPSEKPSGSHICLPTWESQDLLSGINISFTTDYGSIAISLEDQLVRRQLRIQIQIVFCVLWWVRRKTLGPNLYINHSKSALIYICPLMTLWNSKLKMKRWWKL